MWLAGLRQHPAVVREGRRLGLLLLLKVVEPLDRQLAEGDPAPPALLGALLERRLLGVVVGDELEHPGGGLRLGERAALRPAAFQLPTARSVRLGPRASQAADDRLAVARPLPVPEGSGRSLADIRPRCSGGSWQFTDLAGAAKR